MRLKSNGWAGWTYAWFRRMGALVPAFLFCALIAQPGAGQVPQLPNGMTLEQLQQAQQNRPLQPAVPDLPSTAIQQPELQPSPMLPLAPSRLEQILSQRAATQLRLFGYAALGSGRSVAVSQSGAMQDDYVLGPGDEIVVSLRGQENNESRTTVSRNGEVVLPRLSPISASGRTLGSFRQDLEAAVTRAYVATNAFVSLGRVRQVSVLVAGEVNNPGQRVMPGLASVLDAILLSGGIKKSGSLRDIRLQRAGRQHVIDLYSILNGSGGGAVNFRLADGDRILVPLLGPTVAVSGLVRQPAIYELPSGQKSMAVRSLIDLAGGQEIRGTYRISVLRVDADGRTNLVELRDQTGTVQDSEILFVQLGAEQTVNRITLAGGGLIAGNYAINDGAMLSSFLKMPGAMGETPYTLFGVISRRDPVTLMRTLTAFTPSAVLKDEENLPLQSDDIVRIFSMSEIELLTGTVQEYSARLSRDEASKRNPLSASDESNRNLADKGQPGNGQENDALGGNGVTGAAVAAAANAASKPATATSSAIQSLSGRTVYDLNNTSAMRNDPLTALGTGAVPGRPNGLPSQIEVRPSDAAQNYIPGNYAANRSAITFAQVADQLATPQIVLANFLLDRQVYIEGAVRGPGNYFVGSSVRLRDLIQAVGGPIDGADRSSVEVISPQTVPESGLIETVLTAIPLNSGILASYVVKPREIFRFNDLLSQAEIGSVTLQGEFRFTGAFKLMRGQRLSDVIRRAGGLTNMAYPYGTVFLRKSVAASEQDTFVRIAKEIDDQILLAMTRSGDQRMDPTAVNALRAFGMELRNQKALGRISVVADPSILASRPGLDPFLENGDVIYIPQRPSTVAVMGQVMQPGNFPYEPNATVADYIDKAGGYGSFSDSSKTYIVLPDGSARTIERSWLRFSPATVFPPGSTIVIPRDTSPLDLRQTITGVTQLFSQLAVSIASLAVLSKN